MTQRERILAIAVAAIAVLVIGFFGIRRVNASLTQRAQTLERLRTDKKQRERLVKQGQLAQARLERYRERSLPPDPKAAEQLYMDWLFQTVTKIGFDEPKVNPVSGVVRSRADAFKAQGFTVSGSGSLEMLTRLLHQFYNVDYLHRIKGLTVNPRDPKTVAFTMTVEALSLPDAPERDDLHLPPSRRLSGSVEDYIDAICGRNMFGPPNVAPTLEVNGESAQTNREVTISPTASDPEGDQLTYSFDSAELTGAKIDEETGKLTWTPKKPGEYLVTISVRDDGVPSRTAKEQIKIAVTDPPPPPVAEVKPPEEKKPPYDQVQFAVVSGITETNGERQVWLIDRPRNKIYYLRDGESFKIGEFEGVVKHIGTVDVEFEWYDRRALVPMGEKLGEDKELKGDELINLREEPKAS